MRLICVGHLIIPATLTVLIPAASARAATHRFAPATEISVSFELRKLKTTGTLLRFTRNRLVLKRTRAGALVLRTGSSRRVARPLRHTLRVRAELSARDATAKLIADGRTAMLTGRFVADDAVIVRSGGALRRVRIQTGDSPPPVPQSGARATIPGMSSAPSPAPSPAPAAGTASVESSTSFSSLAPKPLFAPDGVWNKPVPAGAALDPASAVLVKKLSDTITDGFAAGRASWIQTSNGSTPLYVAQAGAPTVRVTLDAGAWATSLQQAFAAVPIPSNAAPAAGVDGHMTVWQPSSDRLWEFFKARKLTDGWHASFGGAIAGVSTFPGYYSDSAWPGLSHSYWGATATSLPVIAGTMLISELKAGVIPHALALNIPYARPKVYSWPAQRTDGTSTDPGAIPEGAHFRLDPTLDLTKLNLPPMTRMMAEAAQRYGMIVRDQTNWAVAVFAEDPTPTGTSPYGGPSGFYGGRLPSDLMKAFPWNRLQLLKMELHTQ